MKRVLSMIAAMAVVSSMALGASAALEVIPGGKVFDAEYYAAQNPDVVAVVGTDTMALYNHYQQSGQKEGREPYDKSAYSQDYIDEFYANNFKRSDKYPIEVMEVLFTINSAGGVSPIVLWNNNTGKQIKYITFYMTPYNAVKDPVADEVTGNNTFACKVTGPIDSEKGIGEYAYDYYGVYWLRKNKNGTRYYELSYPYYRTRWVSKDVATIMNKKKNAGLIYTFSQASTWKTVWYNSTTDKIKISMVKVEYMDGTSQTISELPSYYSTVVDCWEIA